MTAKSYEEALDEAPEARQSGPLHEDTSERFPGDHLDRDDLNEDGEPILADLGDYADHGYRWAQEKERSYRHASAPWWQKSE